MATKPRFFDPHLYYHIYNCGVEKRNLFVAENDWSHFLETIDFYLYSQCIGFASFRRLDEETKRIYIRRHPRSPENLRVKIAAYCLMPNHFHFLIKPIEEDGITRFISDISNSHARYFNIKNERIGSLFQGPFKSKEILSEESLLQVSRYIHLNPVASLKTNPDGMLKPEDYPYSSYTNWVSEKKLKGLFTVNWDEVSKWVNLAGGAEKYRKFVESKMDTDSSRGIENLILEEAPRWS